MPTATFISSDSKYSTKGKSKISIIKPLKKTASGDKEDSSEMNASGGAQMNGSVTPPNSNRSANGSAKFFEKIASRSKNYSKLDSNNPVESPKPVEVAKISGSSATLPVSTTRESSSEEEFKALDGKNYENSDDGAANVRGSKLSSRKFPGYRQKSTTLSFNLPPSPPRGLKNPGKQSTEVNDEPIKDSSASSIIENHKPNSAQEETEEDNDDPLLALFRVHNTHRVKFDLTSPDEKEKEKANTNTKNKRRNPGNEKKESSHSQFNIKKFVRSSIFGNPSAPSQSSSCLLSREASRSSSETSSLLGPSELSSDMDEAEQDAIIKKMMAPSAPRRIGSFLNLRGGEDKNGRKSTNSIDPTTSKTHSFSTIDGGLITSNQSKRNANGNHSISSHSKESIAKLLKKAQKAHRKSFRYRVAMKYYLMALKELSSAGHTDNPESDPLMNKILKSLNDVHHCESTLANSANIVKMGVEHEDKNQLVRALKMYTIAYRMRRDVLGVDHPSLPVLLNMMGSVQVKRGEYVEAMQIYDLALKGRPDENGGKGRRKSQFREQNPLTTSVTLRDMGMILENRGLEEKALKFYHASLRYSVKFRAVEDLSNVASGQNGENNVETAVDIGAVIDDAAEHDAGGDVLTANTRLQDGDSEEPSEMTNSENGSTSTNRDSVGNNDTWLENMDNVDEPFSLEEVRMVKVQTTAIGKYNPVQESALKSSEKKDPSKIVEETGEMGEMELFLEKRFDRWAFSQDMKSDSSVFYYDMLFKARVPGENNSESSSQKVKQESNWEGADADIAMTLHQIGQIHRRGHRYAAALSAYKASLRGMKQVLGTKHANIAAILGNIGNLYMEIGDFDEAFVIYQEVLGIETLHLGLSHPEVAVTLHNIATIECSRGNFSEGVSLYRQVVDMQKIRYGHEHITVAITLSCLADAYEKLTDVKGAIKTYEEALKIRIAVLGRNHLDVGRLMHKLGRLASSREDYRIANMYLKRAAEIYVVNQLSQDHVFLREMARDSADMQAGLAFVEKGEC